MDNVKSIMAACDFSEYAPQVVSYAVDLAKKLNSKLLVVNIINRAGRLHGPESCLGISLLFSRQVR